MIRFVDTFDLAFGGDPSPVHDEVVLIAAAMKAQIVEYLENEDLLLLPWSAAKLQMEPESEIRTGKGQDNFVDLALLDPDGSPVFYFECKSKREPQSASAWYRQIRSYLRSGVPCALVVAHDLDDVVRQYLKAAKVVVIDLRQLTP